MAYEELVIRYDADARFETDLVVKTQEEELAVLAAWTKHFRDKFRDGTWCFSGQIQCV